MKRNSPQRKAQAWWPYAIAALLALWALKPLLPKGETGLHTESFGRLPVLLNGRIQPFESVARNSLLQIRGKQKAPIKLHFSIWRAEQRGKLMPATDWLLEVLFKPSLADTRKIFRIDHPDLITLLRLPGPNPAAGEDGKHFSFDQLSGSLTTLEEQARSASDQEAAQRTSYERQTLKLWNALGLYRRLKSSIKPESTHDLAAVISEYRAALPPGLAAIRSRQASEPFSQADLDQLIRLLRPFDPVAQMAYPLVVPPTDPEADRTGWNNYGVAVLNATRTGNLHPAVDFYARLATAYHNESTGEFNSALKDYHAWLQTDFGPELKKAKAETLFNAMAPFYTASVIDVIAFLAACFYFLATSLSWNRLSEGFRRTAVWVLFVGVAVHTAGLLYRMILEGRPPVTNLYSSAVFIGWGSAILGLVLERFHRIGIGVATGGFVGFVTLVIAHNLGLGGDTMEMMRAVLDSNFWLATHVVTITIGYSAMFVAGFFGILLLILGPFTPVLKPPMDKIVGRLIYGIICFATLFSFVGTILGGIWADQSWGRFWGWDPKENGALLIVLWCAVMLHARWGGLVRERGFAAMAIFGNIITSFSWFGVNMLGVGLHSYGFMDSGFFWLTLFVASQILAMLLALIPTRHWTSLTAGLPAREPPAMPRR